MKKRHKAQAATSLGQRLLTISEVAKFLRLHHSTVYRLAREERLPAVKIGSQWRFHQSHIEQWLEECGWRNHVDHE